MINNTNNIETICNQEKFFDQSESEFSLRNSQSKIIIEINNQIF